MTDIQHIPNWLFEKYDFLYPSRIIKLSGGIINNTYLVFFDQDPFIFQLVHKVFPVQATIDMVAVTTHLRKHNIPTFEIIFTKEGKPFVIEHDNHWRVLSFLGSREDPLGWISNSQIRDPYLLGKTLGEFHNALRNFKHDFLHHRNIHNPVLYKNRLTKVINSQKQHRLFSSVIKYYEEIINNIDKLYKNIPENLTSIVHGDPKLENFIKLPNGSIAMIDLDTVGRHSLYLEVGDGLRSWCEDDGGFSKARFEQAIQGYMSSYPYVSLDLKEIFYESARLISWELACRFAIDTLEESYFSWDKKRFLGRGEHNLYRLKLAITYARSF